MNVEITKRRTEGADCNGEIRRVLPAMMHGLAQRCPSCGKGSLYTRYLNIVDHCRSCGEALHHHRADDAPSYFTILVVGHLIVGGMLILEQAYAPQAWVHAIIWGPLTLILSLWMSPRIKGAFVGLQWALRMHGFSGKPQGAPPNHN